MSANYLYGLLTQNDISGDALLTSLGQDRIRSAYEMTLQMHNAAVNTLLTTFADPTTAYTERVLLPGGGELQPMDENGVPKPRKGSQYDVAFPITMAGTKWETTWVTYQKMSVRRFSQLISDALIQDMAYVRRKLLTALFKNDTYTFSDKDFGVSLTIQPLANNDAVLYPVTGSEALATDNHYAAQTTAIADATNPFTAIRDEILEHPDNTGNLIAFVATANLTAVRSLAEYVPLRNGIVQQGANTDTLAASGPTRQVPGEIVGYLEDSRTWISHWRAMPTGYQIVIPEGGPRPLKYRQDAEAGLQGFRAQGRADEFPYLGEYWMRRIGFGGGNRVGAFVQQTSGGDTTYDIPTGYNSPLD